MLGMIIIIDIDVSLAYFLLFLIIINRTNGMFIIESRSSSYSSPKFKLFVHKEIISESLSVGNKAVWSTIIKSLRETGKSQINMIIVYLLDLC